MRPIIVLGFLLLLAVGCGKKQPPAPAAETESRNDAPAPDTTATDRSKLLKDLKSTNQKTRRDAVEELAGWVDTDPETVVALLELLKDKSTSGSGRIMGTQINSTREAAATALLWSGPKGEAALKDKGLSALREGLKDPQAAVREHTAYTIGLLGTLARPLSPDVMKLCTDSESHVRGAAFDALNSIGVTDVAGFAALLNNPDLEIGKLAAEQIHSLTEIPGEAIMPLTTALGSPDQSIRIGAAAGLAAAGPKAAPAATAIMEAINKFYPAEFNVRGRYDPGSEVVFWRALARIGEPAVVPTIDLLIHTNSIVRATAAQTLGKIGPPAKPAVEKLKGALKDKTIAPVPIEAACALCAIGEGKDEAIQLMKELIDYKDVTAQLAIEAIPRMGEAGKPLVEIALGKLNGDVPVARYAAAGLIGTLPAEEGGKYAAQLGNLTTDKVVDIRHQSGLVLEKLGPAAAPAAEALGKAYKVEANEIVREQFLDALIAIGPGAKPALPVLLSLAGDKSLIAYRRIRIIAAITAADPGSREVATVLIAAAGDKDPTIRTAAATGLGKLDPLPAEASAKLVALARTDSHTNTRVAAVRSLAAAAQRAKGTKADLEAIAAGPQPGLALWAKVGLASMEGDVKKSAGAVRAALTDRNPSAREAGAEALLLLGPATTDVPTLINLLKDPNSSTRAAAANCLGALGTKSREALPQLVPLLNDGDGDVRIAAAEALGNIGAVTLPIMKRLKALEVDPLVQSTARRAQAKLLAADKKPARNQ